LPLMNEFVSRTLKRFKKFIQMPKAQVHTMKKSKCNLFDNIFHTNFFH